MVVDQAHAQPTQTDKAQGGGDYHTADAHYSGIIWNALHLTGPPPFSTKRRARRAGALQRRLTRALGVHRATARKRRNGSSQPYLALSKAGSKPQCCNTATAVSHFLEIDQRGFLCIL